MNAQNYYLVERLAEQRRAEMLAAAEAERLARLVASARSRATESIRAAAPAGTTAPVGYVPYNFDDLQQLTIVFRAAGAAILLEHGSSLSPEQRRPDRRVGFRTIRFIPS